jgi:plasmid stabilization system protein ParE
VKYRLRLRPEFREDVVATRDWYAAERLSLGDDFVTEVLSTLDSVQANPLSYQEVEPTVRRAVVSRFPYLIFYRLLGTTITVLACTHGSREPDNWNRLA